MSFVAIQKMLLNETRGSELLASDADLVSTGFRPRHKPQEINVPCPANLNWCICSIRVDELVRVMLQLGCCRTV